MKTQKEELEEKLRLAVKESNKLKVELLIIQYEALDSEAHLLYGCDFGRLSKGEKIEIVNRHLERLEKLKWK